MLSQGSAFQLKGAAFNSFGAFFNRSWREHDYLWGRLNAAERLFNIVLSAAPEVTIPEAELLELKRALFLAILGEEEEELIADPDLLPAMTDLVKAL